MSSENENFSGIDKREHPRISGSIIEYSYIQTDGVRLTAFMKDLSVGGVCIYVHDELELGTELDMLVHHFGCDAPIEAMGEVVWQRESNFMNCFDTGVKFTDVKVNEKVKLVDFIDSFTKGRTSLLAEGEVELSTPEGVYKQFYSSGELLSEVNVIQGKMEGLKRYYYRTGETLEELNWINGKRHGLRRCYYPNGIVYIEQEFKEDISIDIKKYDKEGRMIKPSK